MENDGVIKFDVTPDVADLAQKMFNEDGNPGNLYHLPPATVRFWENKALKVIEEE